MYITYSYTIIKDGKKPQVCMWVWLSLYRKKIFRKMIKRKVPVFLQKLFCLRGLPSLY